MIIKLTVFHVISLLVCLVAASSNAYSKYQPSNRNSIFSQVSEYKPHKKSWIHNNWAEPEKVKSSEGVYELKPQKVNVKIYYESLCPYCIKFVVEQLQSAATSLQDYVDIVMIPYGNARMHQGQDGVYTFECQHGPDECLGNKLHACAIDALGNNTKAVVFNACMMKYSLKRTGYGWDFVSALLWCSEIHDASAYNIWQCAVTKRGTELLKNYGIETNKAKLHGVPFITLNDSADGEDAIYDNLKKAICQKLQPQPKACEKKLKHFIKYD